MDDAARVARYGDLIFLETVPVGADDTARMLIGEGLVGVEDYKSFTSRLLTLTTVQYHMKGNKLTHELSNDVDQGRINISSLWKSDGAKLGNPDSSQFQLPPDYLNRNLFQIAYGIGAESPGEPVTVGSPIRLLLVSSNELVRANLHSESLELIPKDFKDSSVAKECSFRVKSINHVRREGDQVHYRDLVQLVDFRGRSPLWHTNNANTQLKMISHQDPSFGFRLRLLAPYQDRAEAMMILQVGDIIQLRHKVTQSFLFAGNNGESSHCSSTPGKTISASLWQEQQMRVMALKREEIDIDTCNTFWQVETPLQLIASKEQLHSQHAPPQQQQHQQQSEQLLDWNVSGSLSIGNRFLLKHVITGKYLCVSANVFSRQGLSIFSVIDVANEDCLFELRSNVMTSLEEEDPERHQAIQCDHSRAFKLLHSKSNEIVSVLRTDSVSSRSPVVVNVNSLKGSPASGSKSQASMLTLMKNAVDGEIFEIFKATQQITSHINNCRRIGNGLQALLFALKDLQTFSVVHDQKLNTSLVAETMMSRMVKIDLMNKLVNLIESLHRENGALANTAVVSSASKTSSADRTTQNVQPSDESYQNVSATILDDLGFPITLVQVAHIALRRLADNASGLEETLQNNFLADESEVGKVVADQMRSILQTELKLAILAYQSLRRMLTIHSDSVHALLNRNCVSIFIDHLRILRMVPSSITVEGPLVPPLLELLAAVQVESRRKHVSSNTNVWNMNQIVSDDNIVALLDIAERNWIKNGAQDEYVYEVLARLCKPSPSLVHIDTSSDSTRRCLQNMIAQRLFCLSESRASPRNAIFMHRMALDWNSNDQTSRTFFVSSSRAGMRKMDGSIVPLPLPENATSIINDDQWLMAAQLRDTCNELDLPHSLRSRKWKLTDIHRLCAEHIMHQTSADILGAADLIAVIDDTLSWKPLLELTAVEIRNFSLFLHLLSCLCAGRNPWTQRLVRKVLPVDFILHCLDYIRTEETYRFHSRRGAFTGLDQREWHHLLSIKNGMLEVLYHCYIDSAFLLCEPEQVAVNTDALSWTDVFDNETSKKLFGIQTQMDCEWIRFDAHMTISELSAHFHLFDYDIKAFLVQHNAAGLLSLFSQLQSLIASGDQERIRKATGSFSEGIKLAMANYNVHSLEQRAVLIDIMKNFIEEELQLVWEHDVLVAYSRLCVASTRSSLHAVPEVPTTMTARDSTKVSLSTKAEYLESMLYCLRSLMLKRIFDVECNCNPEYHCGSEDPKLFYSQLLDTTHFAFQKIVLSSEKIGFVVVCVEPLDEDAFHEDSHIPNLLAAYSPQRKDGPVTLFNCFGSRPKPSLHHSWKHKKSFYQQIAKAAKISNADFVRLVMKSILHLLAIVGPQTMLLEQVALQQDDKRVDEYFSIYYGGSPTVSGKTHANLSQESLQVVAQHVQFITLSMCKVLSVCLDVFYALTDVELRRIFQESFEKLLHSRVINEGNDLLAAINAENTELSQKRKSENSAPATELSSAQLNLRDRILLEQLRNRAISKSERDDFLIDTWSSMQKRLTHNPEMVWNIPEMFEELDFHTILNLLYFEQPDLRCQVLYLLQRSSTKRSEMCKHWITIVSLDTLETSKEAQFLLDKEYCLKLYLAHFDGMLAVTHSACRDSTHSCHSFRNDHIQRSQSNRLPQLMALAVSVRSLLFRDCPDNVEQLGLVNFCCAKQLEPTGDASEVPKVEEPKPEGGIQKKSKFAFMANKAKATKDSEKKKLSISFGSICESLSNLSVGSITAIIEANPVHQTMLLNSDLMKTIVQFLVRNREVLILAHESFATPPDPSLSVDGLVGDVLARARASPISPYMWEFVVHRDIYKLMLVALTASIAGNKDSLKTSDLIDTELFSTLLAVRHVVPIAMDVLFLIINSDSQKMRFLTYEHVDIMLSDLRAAAWTTALETQQLDLRNKKAKAGEVMRLQQLPRVLSLLEVLLNTQPQFLPKRSRLIESALIGTAGEDIPLFQRILSLGLQWELSTSPPGPAVSASPGDKFKKLSVSPLLRRFKQEEQEIANGSTQRLPQIAKRITPSQTCYLYQFYTGRITHSRLPRDVLRDSPLVESSYIKLREALRRWPLLQEECPLLVHLKLVSFLATSCKLSKEIQRTMATFFPNCYDLCQLLLIDKWEIKMPYLCMMEVIFFEKEASSSIATASKSNIVGRIQFDDKLCHPRCKAYFKALLYSFSQELRLFLFLTRDTQLSLTEQTLENATILKHYRLMETYIQTAMIPFLKSFVQSQLHNALDELEELPEFFEEQQREQDKLDGGSQSKKPRSPFKVYLNDSMAPPAAPTAAPAATPAASDLNAIQPDSQSESKIKTSSILLNGKMKDDKRLHMNVASLLAETMTLLSQVADVHKSVILSNQLQENVMMKQTFLRFIDEWSLTTWMAREQNPDVLDAHQKSMKLLRRTVSVIEAKITELKQTPMTALLNIKKARDEVQSAAASSTSTKGTSQIIDRKIQSRLRLSLVQDYVGEVDRFVQTLNGFVGLSHLLLVPPPRFIYTADGKEIPISAHLALDDTLISRTCGIHRTQLMEHPLNSNSARYAMREVSRITVAYAQFKYAGLFDKLMKSINDIPDNTETEMVALYEPYKEFEMQVGSVLAEKSRLSVEEKKEDMRDDDLFEDGDQIESDFEKPRRLSGKQRKGGGRPSLIRNTHSKNQQKQKQKQKQKRNTETTLKLDAKSDEKQREREVMVALHFDRWSKRRGKLLEIMFDHFEYCLTSLSSGKGLELSSLLHSRIIECNAYWVMLITRGALRSRMSDLFTLYLEQTETQLAQLAVEQCRLHLMQDVFADLGAVDVMVRHLSVSGRDTVLDYDSVHLLHRIALDLGIALLENGNVKIQNLVIAVVSQHVEFSAAIGKRHNVVGVVRSLLQSLSQGAGETTVTNALSTADGSRLLRFLALLCEGHNQAAQLFLHNHKIIAEVANFVGDCSKFLADDFEQSMFSESVLPSKLIPKIMGIRRNMIRWISPWPSSTRDGNQGRHVKSEFIPVERLGIMSELVAAGLEALSEFCQGASPQIQVSVARSGCISDFSKFFKFFGAFHLVHKMNSAIESSSGPSLLSSSFLTSATTMFSDSQTMSGPAFRRTVRLQYTHEGLIVLPPSAECPIWIGNDPLAMLLMLGVNNSEERNLPESSDDTNLKSVLKRTKPKPLPSARAHNGSYSTLGSNYMDISQVREWDFEKVSYINFCKLKDKYAGSSDGNYFVRIAKFEEKLVKLETSCLKFMASLLEGSATESEIPTIVLHNISRDNLLCNMSNYWKRYKSYQPKYSGMTKDDCFERKMAYAYYSLSMRICDVNNDGGELKGLLDDWLASEKLKIDEDIARIEVHGVEETVPLVAYFPVPSLIKKYWERGDIIELRNSILFPTQQGGRDSAEEKLQTFLRASIWLIATLRHLESLDEIVAAKSWILMVIVNIAHRYNLWAQITFALTIAMNILLLLSVRSDMIGSSRQYIGKLYYLSGDHLPELVRAFGFAHLCFTVITVFSFAIMYGWLYLNMGWRQNPTNTYSVTGFMSSRVTWFINRCGLLGVDRNDLIGNTFAFSVTTFTASIYHLLNRIDCVYYTSLLTFSILGNAVSPLFFACCLIQLLWMSKLMQYVTRAFTENIDQVLATIMLAATILYLFTTLAFSDPHLHNRYSFNGQGENGCNSLQSCFRWHLDYGVLQSMLWKDDSAISTAQGEFFNFGFTFIMQIVIPGLVSGIIIDTFSEMRGYKQSVEEDVNNTCFICNIDREDFETSNIPFDDHVHNDHNMWKYVWFMIYLNEKDRTEFDGIEQFCHDLIKEKDVSTRWLPLKMARALSQVRDKYDLFTIYNKITTLQGSVDKLSVDMKAELQQQEKQLIDALRDIQSSQSGNRSRGKGKKFRK